MPRSCSTSSPSWRGRGGTAGSLEARRSGYVEPCPDITPPDYCGVFHDSGADATIARQYGQCMGSDACLALAKKLPGGFDCFDAAGQLVKP